jgi:hypothetical protein
MHRVVSDQPSTVRRNRSIADIAKRFVAFLASAAIFATAKSNHHCLRK